MCPTVQVLIVGHRYSRFRQIDAGTVDLEFYEMRQLPTNENE
jgi:hypothetical protein